MELEEGINKVFEKILIWFQINLLSLNLNKTYYMQFLSKTNYAVNVNISYKTNWINNVYYTNFLGLTHPYGIVFRLALWKIKLTN